jgi:hypothetical protein
MPNPNRDARYFEQMKQQSNARFVKKSFNLDINTLNALENWIKEGGVITVAKASKRTKKGFSVSKKAKVS